MKDVCVTGIRPTNKLQLGNYFGAIDNIKTFANSYELFIFCADLYSITDGIRNKASCLEIIKYYMIFFPDHHIYLESDFAGVQCELMWYLTNSCYFGPVTRMTQWKDKVQKNQNVNLGWFYYPILMCSNIAITNAKFVPVGEDQKQHIELTRDILEHFNKTYNTNTFQIPEPVIVEEKKIMDLKDPTKKMSKSNEDIGTIFLTDNMETIIKKVQTAKTDSLPMPNNISTIQNERPEIFNLCKIFSLVTGKTFRQIEEQYGNGYTSNFKKDLAEGIFNFLDPIQKKANEISYRDVELFLDRKKSKINKIFTDKIMQVRKVLNFI